MNPLVSINRAIYLLIETLKQVTAGYIWLLLLGYFFIHWLVLHLLYLYPSGEVYGSVSAWINMSIFYHGAAQAFSHYPEHFLLLGYFNGWTQLLLGTLIEGPILGLVAVMFAEKYSGESRTSSRPLFISWLNLMVVWIIINGLLVLMGMFMPSIFEPLLDGPRREMAFTYVIMPFFNVVLLSLFFPSIALVSVKGRNFLKAITESLRLFIYQPIVMFLLAGIVMIMPQVANILNSNPDMVINSFRPELIYWLLLTIPAVEIFANFLWIGSAVKLLSETE